MSDLRRSMKRRLLAVFLGSLVTACATGELVTKYDDQVLVGVTVWQALHRTKIEPETATLYTEPHGVPRGVIGHDQRGHQVFLFFQRGGRPLDLRVDGAADRYGAEAVVGVVRVVGRQASCVGEVVWHFCAKRAP